jgi:hypothetical protein
MTDIYKMKLHEVIYEEQASILRVPGGWIYIFPVSSNFVPMNSEFNRRSENA